MGKMYKYTVIGLLMIIADLLDPIPDTWWKDWFMLGTPALILLLDWVLRARARRKINGS